MAVVVGENRRVLVTGAGGFIGRNLCPVLERAGWRVRPVTERIGHDTDWGEALAGVDAVVHLAARVHVLREQADEPQERFRHINRDATRHLAEQAAAAGVRRFVFISTIGVHGVKTEGRGFRETDAPNPQNAYALSKREAEDALKKVEADTGLEVVILRPPLVYGPGVKANFRMLLDVVRRGIPLPLASICNKRDMVYVGNLADAVRVCLTHAAAAGEVFLVDDDDTVSTPDLIRRIARAMGKTPRLFPFPVALLRLGGWLSGRGDMVNRLVSSLEVDSAHIRGTLGWTPPYGFDDGLLETVRWYDLSEHMPDIYRAPSSFKSL